jgi:transposase InsO family protein
MKQAYPQVGMGRVCWLFGMSRQASYQYFHRLTRRQSLEQVVLDLESQIRQVHPRMGARKRHVLLMPAFGEHHIKMGRDRFYDLLRERGLLMRRKRRKVTTTWSNHPFRKYPNLTGNLKLTAANQLWVSDITFLHTTEEGFVYLFLITDAFSHKVVGFDVSSNMEAINALSALRMALHRCGRPEGLIHHSDRGVQYCSQEYVRLLEDNRIGISMTQTGDPRENPIAERINGILKNEYLTVMKPRNIRHAKELMIRIAMVYNQQRPHLSCGLSTPHQVHEGQITPKRLWKTYPRKKLTAVNTDQD